MKRQTATFLFYLFPLLAPTLAFAHARPHPHPHPGAGDHGSELSDVHKLQIKRQLPVLNDTIVTIDTTSSETSSSSSATTTRAPTSTDTSTVDLDRILSSIESDVLGVVNPTDTTASETTSVPSPKQNSTSTDDVTSTTAPADTSATTTSADSSIDLSIPTDIPVATFTSGLTTGLNTPSLTVQPAIPMDTGSSSITTSADDSTTTTRPQIPIIDTLSDILTSLLQITEDPTSTTTADDSTSTDAGKTEDPTTTTEPPSTTTGLDDILSSILSDVTSVIGDVTSILPNGTDVTSVIDLPTSTDIPATSNLDPTDIITSLFPTDTGVTVPTDLPSNSTIEPTTGITDLPPVITTTSLPVETGAVTTDPSVTAIPTGAANSTVIPSDISVTSLPAGTSGTLTLTGTESTPVTDAVSVTSNTAIPSANLDTSSLWFGTSLVTQGTQTASDQSSSTATATGLPNGVPEAITPPGGVPTEPDNSTLIQIGFTREYNYAFVSGSLPAAAQICNFLPRGLADGLGVPLDQLRMHTLQPLQPDGLDYIVTLGLVYIPADVYARLATDIHIPLSDMYNNKNPTIKQFMNCIDPSIPLMPGANIALVPPSYTGGSGGGDPNDPSWVKGGDNIVDGSQATSTASVDQDGADPYSTDGGSRSPATPKTVTIGIASVGAAALYGVAMYFLAKRYRNNRLSHRRSQSLTGGGIEPPMSDMRSSGALSPMMSTNFFNNGRTSPPGSDKRGSKGSKTSARGQISAPMMSENSLGWD